MLKKVHTAANIFTAVFVNIIVSIHPYPGSVIHLLYIHHHETNICPYCAQDLATINIITVFLLSG